MSDSFVKGFVDTGLMIDSINELVYVLMGLLLYSISYFLLVFAPIYAYINIYNRMRESTEFGYNYITIHIQTAIYTLFCSFVMHYTYFFIFIEMFEVKDSASDLIKTILFIP